MKYKTILGNVVGDSYFAHQVITSAFPDQKVAFFRDGANCVVFSEKEPIAPFAREVYILNTSEFDIQDVLENSNKMFTLRVNPVKRTREGKQKVPDENMEHWLIEHLANIGCEIKQYIHAGSCWDKFVQRKTGKNIQIYYHVIMGMLEIVDEKLFTDNYFKMMGQGKCFGYGLVNLLN